MSREPQGPDSGAPDPDCRSGGPEPSPTGGPVLGLLARGLEFWLRQQCDSIESVEIQLRGSSVQLLRGRLDGVVLVARRVVYRDFRIEEVELRSEPIRVRMGDLLRSQTVSLENPFQVRGQVVFTGDGLNRSLATSQWRALADGLAEALLGLAPLESLRIEDDRLLLSARPLGSSDPISLPAELSAAEGTIEVRGLKGGAATRLPMDPAIRIERAELGSGRLQLEGEARVSP